MIMPFRYILFVKIMVRKCKDLEFVSRKHISFVKPTYLISDFVTVQEFFKILFTGWNEERISKLLFIKLNFYY